MSKELKISQFPELVELSNLGREGPARAFTLANTPYQMIHNDPNYKEGVDPEYCNTAKEAVEHFIHNFDVWRGGRDPEGIVWRRYPILQRFCGKYKCSARVAHEPLKNSKDDFELSFRPTNPAKQFAEA